MDATTERDRHAPAAHLPLITITGPRMMTGLTLVVGIADFVLANISFKV
jgi:hypothetical protein